MGTKFRIEYIFDDAHRKYVQLIARRITNTPFKVTDSSTLNNISIQNWLSQPRVIKTDGSLDLELFVFVLRNKKDVEKLSVNQIVELMNEK
jgi:hypothetical protein